MNLAVLTDIIKVTEKNWRFIFEDPLYDKLNFIPGQLIQLVAKPGIIKSKAAKAIAAPEIIS